MLSMHTHDAYYAFLSNRSDRYSSRNSSPAWLELNGRLSLEATLTTAKNWEENDE